MPRVNEFSFGGCDISKMNEKLKDVIRVINVSLTMREALMLQLAINQCINKLNTYDKRTLEGKNAMVNLAIHTDSETITVNEN